MRRISIISTSSELCHHRCHQLFYLFFLVCLLLITLATASASASASGTQQNKGNDNNNNKDDGDVNRVISDCFQALEAHTMIGEKFGLPFHFYRPALVKYGPHQWLWDSGFHMMAWSHRNVSNAIADLRTMLSMQRPDGRIPEIIFWGPQSQEEQIGVEAQYSDKRFVDLTQMPLLAISLRAIWNSTRDLSLLREFVPKIANYFEWFVNTRSPDGDDLVVIIHPWESGLDASPAYDQALDVKNPQPKLLDIYPKFLELVLTYKWRYHWNQTQIVSLHKNPWLIVDGFFIVKDVGVNSVLAHGFGVLSELALEIGNVQLADQLRLRQLRIEKAIISKCWKPELRQFVSLYKDKKGNEQIAPAETIQTLFPVMLDSIPPEILNEIVLNHMFNESKFWRKFPLPSVSASDPAFNPVFTIDLMWRGPVWAANNYFVMEGLIKHGLFSEANRLLDRWISLYATSGIFEMYNPDTGAAYGVPQLGMSTSIVDMIYRLGRAK